jgi:hypothetical protein
VLGRLHERRARIAWKAGRSDEYDASLQLVDRFYRRTANPALIARCERLSEIRRKPSGIRRSSGSGADATTADPVPSVPSAPSVAQNAEGANDPQREAQTVRQTPTERQSA